LGENGREEGVNLAERRKKQKKSRIYFFRAGRLGGFKKVKEGYFEGQGH